MGSDMQWYAEMEARKDAAETYDAGCDLLRCIKESKAWGKVEPLLKQETRKWIEGVLQRQRDNIRRSQDEEKRRKLRESAIGKLSKAELKALRER